MANKLRGGFLLVVLGMVVAGCPGPTQQPVPMDAVAEAADAVDDEVTPTDVVDVVDVADGVDVPSCPSVDFVSPRADQVLGVNDDADRNCSNGFAVDVRIATDARQGSTLALFVNGRMSATAMVTGPSVTFTGVTLDTGSASTLAVREMDSSMNCRSISVTVNCDVPRCQVTAPDRNVLLARDNTSGAMGMGFTINFVVGTDVEDGQQVELAVSGRTTPLRAPAMGGMATFRDVSLAPDGEYRVRATCTNRVGNVGTSMESTFTVDSRPPELTLVRPMNGALVGVMSDTNPMRMGTQFQVCARSDAAGQRLCAQIERGRPDDPGGCAMVPAAATTEVCVEVTCPDGTAPFNVEVTTQDERGNPASATVMGVQCQSMLPSVRIVAPPAFAAGMPATILNAARDADPMTPGLQATVIACADRSAGQAQLVINGNPAGMPVALAMTAMGDPCAAVGLSGIVRFPNVTLPETLPDRAAATAPPPANPVLRVDVTDAARDVGRSTDVVLYVDSVVPVLAISSPRCPVLLRPAADGMATIDTLDVQSSNIFPVTLTLRHAGGMMQTFTANEPVVTSGPARFRNIRLARGTWTVTAAATDPAGNAGSTAMGCTITVDNPPVVTFTAPVNNQVFNAASDPTPGTPGFQNFRVQVASDARPPATISLTIGGMVVGTQMASGTGTTTFGPLTLPEGSPLTLSATTSDVPGRGVGTASINVTVDTQAPTAPTGLALAVASRRGGSLTATWLDGSDPSPAGGTRAVDSYEIRYSTVPLTLGNFPGTPLAPFTGRPGTPGAMNRSTVPGLFLEAGYYVGIRAFDAARNPSPTIATAGPIRIPLTVDRITDTAVGLGTQVTGGYDVNGDSFRDVVVGTGSGQTRIYFGSATGLSATNYTVIAGPSASFFGRTAASIGDFNGDGIGDVLVGERGASSTPGNLYLYLGRNESMMGGRRWPRPPATALGIADADMVITGGGTPDFMTANLGFSIARIGDFNCDGLDDFAASAPFAGTPANASANVGAVVIFFGRRTIATRIVRAPTDASVVIRSAPGQVFFGVDLTGAGRLVRGDNCEDLLIGARSVPPPMMSPTGTIRVYAGRLVTSTPITLSLTDAQLTLTGAASQIEVLASGVGDVNADGRNDFAISSLSNGYNRVVLHLSDATGNFNPVSVVGSSTDFFGRSIASISSPANIHPSLFSANPTSADVHVGTLAGPSGMAQLFSFAGRTAWSGVNSVVANHSAQTMARVAITSVNHVGDINGDSFPDVAFGQAQTSQGTVFIIH